MAKVTIRPIQSADRPWLETFMVEHWGAAAQVVRGAIFYPHTLPGFVAEADGAVLGVATYRVLTDGDTGELATLNSVRSGIGVGRALVEAVVDAAKREGCSRLIVVTTNDNMNALRFYQKRGFVLSQLRANALAQSRKLKPQIPEIGLDGIPLRDEIELTMDLDTSYE